MARTVVSSLKKLARDKRGLEEKARRVGTVERRLIDHWDRVLASAGYRLVPVRDDHLKVSVRTTTTGRARVKRFRCPKCDRRFAHPLPMARHMSATHGAKRQRPRRRK